jgi:hypothetical protein
LGSATHGQTAAQDCADFDISVASTVTLGIPFTASVTPAPAGAAYDWDGPGVYVASVSGPEATLRCAWPGSHTLSVTASTPACSATRTARVECVPATCSEFADKERPSSGVAYPPGAGAFMGATYDPVSHYRAAAVFDFHVEHGLTPSLLRDINQRQIRILKDRFDGLGLDPAIGHVVAVPDGLRGGFLAIRTPRALDLSITLRRHGVHCDARGRLLRLGPAPYLRDDQLHSEIDILGAVISS